MSCTPLIYSPVVYSLIHLPLLVCIFIMIYYELSLYIIILYYIISIYLYSSYILFTLLRKVVSYISHTREPYVSSTFSVFPSCFLSSLSISNYYGIIIWFILVTNHYWIVLMVFHLLLRTITFFLVSLDHHT